MKGSPSGAEVPVVALWWLVCVAGWGPVAVGLFEAILEAVQLLSTPDN